MLIQQTLIQYLLQKKNLCEIFKVLTIWGNINLFIRPQHHEFQQYYTEEMKPEFRSSNSEFWLILKNLNYNAGNIGNDLSAEIADNKMPIKNADKKVPIKKCR